MDKVADVDLASIVPYVAEVLDQLYAEIDKRSQVADYYADVSRRDLHRRAMKHLKKCIKHYARMMGEYE